MKTFEYKGYGADGRACRGLVEANDLKDARERLAGMGVLPERVSAAGDRGRRRARAGMGTDTRAMLYRETGTLLESGVPLTQALEVLIHTPEIGEHRARLAGIRDRLREGESLAAALAASIPDVTAFETAAIEVGERTGELGAVLDRLADFLEEQSRLAGRVQTALVYPSIVLVLALFVVFVMMGIMMPALGRMLIESRVELPWLTRLMMAAARWAGPVAVPAAALLLVAGGWARWRARTDTAFRIRCARAAVRLPGWRRLTVSLVNLRFARTLALLLRGGVGLVEGVALAGRATGNAWVEEQALAASERVKHGANLADAVRGIDPLNVSLPGWIQAGEAGGHLDRLLDNAAARYQQQWERFVARLLGVIEPVLILGVGGLVLLVSLSILLPLMSLNRSLMH